MGLFMLLLTFFRTAVRAGSTRAVLTVVVEMCAVLLIYELADRTALPAASRRGVNTLFHDEPQFQFCIRNLSASRCLNFKFTSFKYIIPNTRSEIRKAACICMNFPIKTSKKDITEKIMKNNKSIIRNLNV
jgi:hypothetical protein